MAPFRWVVLAAMFVVAGIAAGCTNQAGVNKGDASGTNLTRPILDAAAAALAQGDAATAATYYRGVYTRDPNDEEAALGFIRSLRLTGAFGEARAVAARTLRHRPSDSAVLAAVGKLDLAMGQAADAVTLLERAVAADPKNWRSHSALGLAYDRLGQYNRADASYEAALKLAPDNAAVLNNYALSRAMADDLNHARELALRAIRAEGADLRVRQNLALIYALSGNMARAEALTKRDLPPALARQTIAYYRMLAAADAASPQP